MSEPLLLLDTSVLLALLRGGPLGNRIDQQFGLSTAATRPLVSIVTHGEIRVLAHCNSWGEQKRAALENALDNLVTIDLGHPRILDAYVEIDVASRAHAAGARKMGKNDLWIAATARATSAKLLTTDRDFDHLAPDLVEIEWIAPR